MKKFAAVLLLVLVAGLFAGCEDSRTMPDGKVERCINVVKDHAKKNVNYELSVQNVVVGAIFSESVVVPIVVLAKETFCPYGYKTERDSTESN